jgi:hypothetical protein
MLVLLLLSSFVDIEIIEILLLEQMGQELMAVLCWLFSSSFLVKLNIVAVQKHDSQTSNLQATSLYMWLLWFI